MNQVKQVWICENLACLAQYAEYINGCVHCATGEPGGSHGVRCVLIEQTKADLQS